MWATFHGVSTTQLSLTCSTEVLEARVIYDRESGRSRGFGFVTYGSSEEVENAISNLDGAVSSQSRSS